MPGGCQTGCDKLGKPTPQDYCVHAAPSPPGGKRCPTTSMVGVSDCDQAATVSPTGAANFEISASGAYMAAQCALPFASPGHLRGLTIQRLFKKVLAVSAPHLFMSSFNELVGGRQASAYPVSSQPLADNLTCWAASSHRHRRRCVTQGNTAINMGLPDDPQNRTVW